MDHPNPYPLLLVSILGLIGALLSRKMAHAASKFYWKAFRMRYSEHWLRVAYLSVNVFLFVFCMAAFLYYIT